MNNSSAAANFTVDTVQKCLTGTIYHFQVTTDVLVVGILLCLLDVLGILTAIPGNVLVILAISLNRSLHHNAEYVLLALAVCDFLFSALLQPLMLAKKIEHLLNRPSCKTATVLQALVPVVFNASIVTEMLVSLERTIAVMAPYWYEERITITRLFAAPLFVWFIWTLVYLSSFWGLTLHNLHLVSSGFIVFCLLVTLICYGILVKVANQHENQVQAQQQQVQRSEEEKRKQKRERKALWTALCINCAYFVGYLPFVLAAIIIAILDPSEEKVFLLRSWAGTLGALVTTANPVILCWRNTRVGQAIKKLLGFDVDNDEAVQRGLQLHT